jgi:hypothetical protein
VAGAPCCRVGGQAFREHQGVSERDDVQETGDAHTVAVRGAVDEVQGVVVELWALGAVVRATVVGGHVLHQREQLCP